MMRMKRNNRKCFLLIFLLLLLAGCSGVDINQYQNNTPKFDLFSYFEGTTKGWGIVQDRKGALTRQFTVDILGSTDEKGRLVLKEYFDWSDGEQSTRTWTITRTGENQFTGMAPDVVGEATGTNVGNILNWKYILNLEVDGDTYKVNFDDWMFLMPDNVLLNRASMSKFGFHLGDVIIVFNKIEPSSK